MNSRLILAACLALAAWAQGALAATPAGCPPGFTAMDVLGVMPMEGSQAVVLKHPTQRLVLPIWIGPTEAFSIQLRLDRKSFQRPLTHDLLDAAVQQLGGQLTRVQVDDLRDSTFIGTIFLRQGQRGLSLDARPSDAIALAVGNRVPICVAQKVLERAGLRDQETPGPQPQPEPKKIPAGSKPPVPAPAPTKGEELGLLLDPGPP
ncbi:MAG TPA: bifunctional nuclease family protein [Myxococcota bacterium]|nr:bifunctional nuclease family protein [Myxococcota bacterium]HRY96530.1 bifunctional nuclease family protein [Myxococcota bacterium]HSA23227.1 bifunctional nuclease family protein [Myxococcota bacterium]